MNGCSMNIGFYFFDKGLSGVDCSRPDLGNPGVGGTQYCFLLLIYYILRFDPKSYRVRVYCSSDCFFPQGVEKVLVEDIFEGLTESKRRCDDFIIIKDNKDQQLARFIDKLRHRIVIWGHNFYFGDYADWVAKSPSVIANVFVGRQQYDRYIDHPICDKSLFIYNMVPDVVGEKKRDNDGKTVVYLGALIPEKGFLVLAKMWKYILKKVPMARLQVIGGGNTYGEGQGNSKALDAQQYFRRPAHRPVRRDGLFRGHCGVFLLHHEQRSGGQGAGLCQHHPQRPKRLSPDRPGYGGGL